MWAELLLQRLEKRMQKGVRAAAAAAAAQAEEREAVKSVFQS